MNLILREILQKIGETSLIVGEVRCEFSNNRVIVCSNLELEGRGRGGELRGIRRRGKKRERG